MNALLDSEHHQTSSLKNNGEVRTSSGGSSVTAKAGCREAQTYGKVTLRLGLPDRSRHFNTETLVVDGPTEDLVLGRGLMQELGICIDMSRGKVGLCKSWQCAQDT